MGLRNTVSVSVALPSLKILELVDEKTPDHASLAENEKILEKEADRILSKIAEREFVIALAIEGKQFPSETFAKAISEITINGFSDVTFIIGGNWDWLQLSKS